VVGITVGSSGEVSEKRSVTKGVIIIIIIIIIIIMWNLKCTIIPIIIGATGIVTKNVRKNLETIPGKNSIDSLQKTAVIGISHIIRKVLQCET
jgi:sulfite exporter TauE/SafE